MSRIGKLPIHVPAGVTVTIKDNVVTVKGPKGEMTQAVNPDINVTLEDGIIHLTRPTDEKNHRALHGLYRSLINNMVIGCSEGYKKELELVGVGYRVTNTGQLLDLSLGYTHNIYMQLPKEVKVETRQREIRILLLSLNRLINNYWDRFVLRFVHSECRNRIKVKVLSSWVKKFAESLVNQQVSNLRKLKLS